MVSITLDPPKASATPASLSENTPVNSTPRDSAALRRLMEEVRFEDANGPSVGGAYDRAHNRHNR
jgi:hypothetical protein